MSYQPENPYVRKMYSDPNTTAGVLLKVKIKKSKTNNELKKEVVSTSVIGRVNKVYKYDCKYIKFNSILVSINYITKNFYIQNIFV